MKRIKIDNLEEEEIKDMVYNFIDDSIDPFQKLPKHFQDEGVELYDYYIRREEGVLKIGVDGHKFSVNIEREK